MKDVYKYLFIGIAFIIGFVSQLWQANTVSTPTPTPRVVNPTPAPGTLVTITGEFGCLPHRDTSGPQTMECAFGIKDAKKNYYAIADPEMKFVTRLVSGKQITITGVVTENSVATSTYAIVGTIQIQSLLQ